MTKKKPKIDVVGPIWFTSRKILESIKYSSNSIAVFDVTPFRPTAYVKLGIPHEYYIFEISEQFLSDVQLVLNNNNFQMLYKMKRENKIAHKKYMQKLNSLGQNLNFTRVNPDESAMQVISKSLACISMPFTSTALIAKQEGKPAIYYDPSGMIQKDDKEAHGIPVLSGIKELDEWVRIINNDK